MKEKTLNNTNHKGVWVEHGDMAAEIDELLAPLIKTMWKLGIKTIESCQGTPTEKNPNDNGWCRIYFMGVEEARKFLALGYHPTDNQIQSVKEHGLPLSIPINEWKMSCSPLWHHDRGIIFLTCISFPATMVKIITERLNNES